MKKFKKITEDNFDDFDEEKYNDWLSNKVSEILYLTVCDNKLKLEMSLIDCESPIEQLLSIQLSSIGLERINLYNPFINVIQIEKQKIIECGGNKYRVDFLIPVWYTNQGGKMFVVECDGYEFHQKTKEQVENDNIRQRNLQKEGYEVIRFSGTEIYHNSYNCALEIKRIILSKCEYRTNE